MRSSWQGDTQVSSCALLLGGDGKILISVSLGLSWELELVHQAGWPLFVSGWLDLGPHR